MGRSAFIVLRNRCKFRLTGLTEFKVYQQAKALYTAEIHGTSFGEALTGLKLGVLCVLKDTRTNKEIALALQNSERTVELHVSNILAKLGDKSRLEAALWAKEHRFV